MPQLALQHTSPTLQVLGPQETLLGATAQGSRGHDPPGGVQMPQLALQHTCPSGHVAAPQAMRADRPPSPLADTLASGVMAAAEAPPSRPIGCTAACAGRNGSLDRPRAAGARRGGDEAATEASGSGPGGAGTATGARGTAVATLASRWTPAAGGGDVTVGLSVGIGGDAGGPQSAPLHPGSRAGQSAPRRLRSSSHRVKTTITTMNTESAAIAPKIQLGSVLMWHPPSRPHVPPARSSKSRTERPQAGPKARAE